MRLPADHGSVTPLAGLAEGGLGPLEQCFRVVIAQAVGDTVAGAYRRGRTGAEALQVGLVEIAASVLVVVAAFAAPL